jgi:hypothetical protein
VWWIISVDKQIEDAADAFVAPLQLLLAAGAAAIELRVKRFREGLEQLRVHEPVLQSARASWAKVEPVLRQHDAARERT